MRGLTEGERLFKLLCEYVNRKFTVLADLTERSFSTQQGVLSMTAWAKFKAAQTMAASLQVPTVGWMQVYLLLSTPSRLGTWCTPGLAGHAGVGRIQRAACLGGAMQYACQMGDLRGSLCSLASAGC